GKVHSLYSLPSLLECTKKLGEGAFGEVYKGILRMKKKNGAIKNVDVAIKLVSLVSASSLPSPSSISSYLPFSSASWTIFRRSRSGSSCERYVPYSSLSWRDPPFFLRRLVSCVCSSTR